MTREQVVVAETYPAEFYGHLGIRLPASKRQQAARLAVSSALRSWLERDGIRGRATFDPDAEDAVRAGFGERADGEDRFDAFVGLIGMLNIVLAARVAGEPEVGSSEREVEGWILGQQVSDALFTHA